MPTNYASSYARSLSQQYPYVLRFGALYARNQEGDYRWTSAHTVEVPSVHVTGRVDGSRNSFVERVQRHSNTWTSLALRNHRMWSDFIHPRDIVETNEALSIQNITRVMNEEEKFPEKDKYLLSTIYTDWMKERVFSIASVTTPDEWIVAITGEPLDTDYFCDYLEAKYSDIYGL